MENILTHLKKMDWALTLLAMALVLMGLVSLYSSSQARGNFFNFQKQLLFLGLGMILMLIFSFLDWRIFRLRSGFILGLYFLGLLSLLVLLFFGPQIRGVRSWFRLGAFFIHPIEPLKLVLIILLAKYFSMRHIEMYNVSHILISGVYVFFPAALVFFQPDLGSVLILVLLWKGMLLASGIKLRHFLMLILAFLLAFMVSWQYFLLDYQKERIVSFLVPEQDLLGIAWSRQQSQIAIGSGGVWGQGFGAGSQVQMGFLVEPQTDFIFAAIAHEFGLVGVVILLALMIFLFFRILETALEARSNFARLFASGFGFTLLVQALVHISMNLGLLPIIGISLPLVSYGGSGLLFSWIGLGILQSLKAFP